MQENNDNINTKKKRNNRWMWINELSNIGLGRVVRKVDNVIHRRNHHPADFFNTYPQDIDLSGG